MANGLDGQQPAGDGIVVTPVKRENGCKLAVTTRTGQYLGMVEIEHGNPAMLPVLAQALAMYAQQQVSQVQVAPASALGGIRRQ